MLLPIALLVPLIGLLDKTIFLALRAEHYWTTIVCFTFAGNWIAGAKDVQLALWFFAGVSKLNHHFPSVVGVMVSNSPLTRFAWFRRSMYARFPQKTLQPFNLQLPHASGGCGGIDIFTGSFSFVNSDQLIAMAKSVINSAKGYIFKLAIHALSGLIGNVLDENMKTILDAVNQSKSSCQLAETAVNSALNQFDLGGSNDCMKSATSQGTASDWSAAIEQCASDSGRNSVAQGEASSTDPNVVALKNSNTTAPHNVTWQMLMNNPEFSSRDQQFREMVMTLVGTVVFNTDGAGTTSIQHYGGDGKAIFRSILDGTATTSTTILSCGGDAAQCLNPTSQTLTISPSSSIKGLVNASIIEMQSDIQTSAPISTRLQALLQSTHIPLYRILVVFSAKEGGLTAGDIDNLSELVSFDIVDRMLSKVMADVATSQNFSSQADQAQFEAWQAQYQSVLAAMRDERDGMKNRMDALQGWIQRTALIETTLQNSLSTQMQASIGYARNLRKPGLN